MITKTSTERRGANFETNRVIRYAEGSPRGRFRNDPGELVDTRDWEGNSTNGLRVDVNVFEGGEQFDIR